MSWKDKAFYGGDSEHEIIYNVKLKGNAELHRFENRAGAPYSAIIKDNEEVWNMPREHEEKMVEDWNEWGWK